MTLSEYPGTPVLKAGDRVVFRTRYHGQPDTDAVSRVGVKNGGCAGTVAHVGEPDHRDSTDYHVTVDWDDTNASPMGRARGESRASGPWGGELPHGSCHAAWLDNEVLVDSIEQVEAYLRG